MKESQYINLTENALKFIELYLKDIKMRGRCPLGKTDIYILANGEVKTGCYNLPSIGNIFDSTDVVAMLNGNIAKDNLLKMEQRQCQGCTCGYIMQSEYVVW